MKKKTNIIDEIVSDIKKFFKSESKPKKTKQKLYNLLVVDKNTGKTKNVIYKNVAKQTIDDLISMSKRTGDFLGNNEKFKITDGK